MGMEDVNRTIELVKKIGTENPDLLFGVVTDKSIPVVFMSVVDPVVAQIVPSWQAGSATHTGATLYPDYNPSLAFVKQLLPSAKRIGVGANPPVPQLGRTIE